MQILLITLGSAGDVYPCIALGTKLQAIGHDVRLVAPPDFRDAAEAKGLAFSEAGGGARECAKSSPGARLWIDAGRNPVGFARGLVSTIEPHLYRGAEDYWRASQDAELIIAFGLGILVALPISEGLGIPMVQSYAVPVFPTRSFPFYLAPSVNWSSPIYNKLSYFVAVEAAWQFLRPTMNKLKRHLLGVSRPHLISPYRMLLSGRYPALCAYSPSFVPKPPDWGDWIEVTGYWFLDQSEGWEPPIGLRHFIDSGPAPVYVGFGSMSDRSALELTGEVFRALSKLGQRGVLATGWGGLVPTDLSERFAVVEHIPHEWLFPRIGVAIHHSGAGTLANAIRAGVPSVTIPFMGDQFFWAQRAYEAGVATEPIPRSELSESRLTVSLETALSDPHLRERAQNMGRRIATEDGLEQAAIFLQEQQAVRI